MGRRKSTYFSYVPTALSKPPATRISSVAVTMIPMSVCIAFSTWLSSLARVGFSRFHGASLPWLNATSTDMGPFAKSRRNILTPSVYRGSENIGDSALHPSDVKRSFRSVFTVDEIDFFVPSPFALKCAMISSSDIVGHGPDGALDLGPVGGVLPHVLG